MYINVGDTITVSWDGNDHNVNQFLNETAYENCDFLLADLVGAISPVIINATSPGIFYYGCSVADHCSKYHMKLIINVTEPSFQMTGNTPVTGMPSMTGNASVTGMPSITGNTPVTGISNGSTGSNQGTSQMTSSSSQVTTGHNQGVTSGVSQATTQQISTPTSDASTLYTSLFLLSFTSFILILKKLYSFYSK